MMMWTRSWWQGSRKRREQQIHEPRRPACWPAHIRGERAWAKNSILNTYVQNFKYRNFTQLWQTVPLILVIGAQKCARMYVCVCVSVTVCFCMSVCVCVYFTARKGWPLYGLVMGGLCWPAKDQKYWPDTGLAPINHQRNPSAWPQIFTILESGVVWCDVGCLCNLRNAVWNGQGMTWGGRLLRMVGEMGKLALSSWPGIFCWYFEIFFGFSQEKKY